MLLATDVPERLADSHRAWLQAVNRSDLSGYAEVVAENVVWIPPGQDAVEGRANFRRWLTPFFEEYDYEFAVTDCSFRMAGRWAAERGRFHSRLTPRDAVKRWNTVEASSLSGGRTTTPNGGSIAISTKRLSSGPHSTP